MTNELATQRRALGRTQQEFCELLKPVLPALTESRLAKLETGRLRATDQERRIFSQFFQARSWELFS